MEIRLAETEQQIMACYPVLSQIRPQLEKQDYIQTIAELSRKYAYQLVYLQSDGIKAVAGIRMAKWLHTGKYLEIEELITDEYSRSMGYGGKLFDWIVAYATQQKCSQVRLVSGVLRERAHQFYLAKGMEWEAKYFSLNIAP